MMINRRRVYGGKKLPYDAEIEYLESSGTQWINTGVYPDNKYSFDTKIAVLQDKYICIYWGCRNEGNYLTQNSQCYLNSNNEQTGDANKIHLYSTSTTDNRNWNSGIKPSVGVMYSFAGMTVVSTMKKMIYPITLFAFNVMGSVITNVGLCRIGLFKAYSQGEKIIDMIPVRVGQVGYMYDKVSGRLFGNAGTGSFILGPDKT